LIPPKPTARFYSRVARCSLLVYQ